MNNRIITESSTLAYLSYIMNDKKNFYIHNLIDKLNNNIKNIMSLTTYELPQDKNSELSILSYENDFIKEYKNKYPKTFCVRNNLIMMRQIRPDVVTKKSDWMTKIRAGLIGKNYSEVYPKTIKTREFLLENNKILKNKVTPKFNLFKKIKFAKKLGMM